jgi:hypothetical protein
MKRVFIFFLILLSLLSCDKSESYPKTYVYNGYETGEIKLYTNSGEIKDQVLINKSLGTILDFDWFEEPRQSYKEVKIEILSPTKGRFTNDLDSVFELNITRKDGILYFEDCDTFVGNISPIFYNDERLKYSPLYNVSIPTTTGFLIRTVPCMYFIEDDGAIYLPKVYYYEKYESSNIRSVEGIKNAFNEKYLLKIKGSNIVDTIAYQNNRVIYREE